MKEAVLNQQTRDILKMFQRTEITEYHVYRSMARGVSGKNAEILDRIAMDEKRHHDTWKNYTQQDVRPNRILLLLYLLISKVMGITFAIKVMERGEERAERSYALIESIIPEVKTVIREEKEHENMLVEMIDEERIHYIGSMILGLNDAIVELTGALAGLTLALQNTRLIGLAGLITGVAASLSMAASEYLSQKSEPDHRDPLRASLYTGIAYIVAVILLVTPYFAFDNYYFALGLTLTLAIMIILIFAQFVAVVKDMSFKKFFLEMVIISMGVAMISFFIGWLARTLLHIEA